MRTRIILGTVVALVAAAGLYLLAPGPASGSPQGKTTICHATASNTNPYVRIEVNNNSLPAHFGQVGNSHQHQRSLGRYDFIWTPRYDENCVRIPTPISVTCSNSNVPGIVVGVEDVNGQTVRHELPCPAVHARVELPIGVNHIECQRGTTTNPYFQTYWLDYPVTPTTETYGVNCVSGETRQLDIQGGTFQLICPAEGQVALYNFGFLSGPSPRVSTCTPGSIVPSTTHPVAANSFHSFTSVIDWFATSGLIVGRVRCPASGEIAIYYIGDGAPTTYPGLFRSFACTPNQPFDVTTVTL